MNQKELYHKILKTCRQARYYMQFRSGEESLEEEAQAVGDGKLDHPDLGQWE